MEDTALQVTPTSVRDKMGASLELRCVLEVQQMLKRVRPLVTKMLRVDSTSARLVLFILNLDFCPRGNLSRRCGLITAELLAWQAS